MRSNGSGRGEARDLKTPIENLRRLAASTRLSGDELALVDESISALEATRRRLDSDEGRASTR